MGMTVCTSIASDPSNCGGCGNVCAPGAMCVSGACMGVPHIQVDVATLVFPATPVGGGAPIVPLPIRNTGTSPLQVGAATIVGPNAPDFHLVSPLPPLSVPPGAVMQLNVQFTPTGLGMRSATIQIQSNDPARPTVPVPANGQGL
jgi:hypothetical protein